MTWILALLVFLSFSADACDMHMRAMGLMGGDEFQGSFFDPQAGFDEEHNRMMENEIIDEPSNPGTSPNQKPSADGDSNEKS